MLFLLECDISFYFSSSQLFVWLFLLYALSKTLVRQIQKDKSFHKWLIANRDFKMTQGGYYCHVLLKAYKQKLDLQKLQAYEERKKKFLNNLSPISERTPPTEVQYTLCRCLR